MTPKDDRSYFDDGRFDVAAVEHACAFLRHLRVERGLSENTVRAYALDIRSYFDWAARCGYDLKAHHHALADAEACAWIAKTIL